MTKKFDNFIFESYGSNKLVEKLTNYLIDVININIGKLILNNQIVIENSLEKFKDIIFINDKINIKLSDRYYGNMNTNSIIIKSDIITNLIINLELILSHTELKSKQISRDNKIFSTINHELLHVVELYLTNNNNKSISKSWKYGGVLQKLQEKYIDYIEWQDISYFIYLSLPHEMRSRISDIQEKIHNIKGIKIVTEIIKKDKTYKDADFLSNIDTNILLKKLKSNKDYINLILDFNKIFLNNDITDIITCEKEFIKYMNKLKEKNKYLKKKLLKTAYNFEHFEFPIDECFDKNINYDKYL